MSAPRTLLVKVLILLLASSAGAQELGLVGARNQFPFNQLFLGLTPQGADTLPEGATRASLSVSWSNTFILSKDVRSWVVNLRTPGRHELDQAEIAQLLAFYPHRDLYLFDGEIARWNLRLGYGLTNTLQLTVEAAAMNRGGGFADQAIESFHDLFHFANAEREYFPQNNFQVFMRFGDQQFFRDGAPGNTVLGDTTFELKLRTPRRWHGWLTAAAAAVKAPTGSQERFGGSGRWDSQLAGFASRRLGPGSLHVNLAYTSLGGIANLPGFSVDNLWTVVTGYELWSPRHRVNWILQTTAETSVFRDRTTSDLAQPNYLILFGARFPTGEHGIATVAFVENVVQQDNSTDVAVHVGYSRVFGRH